MGDAQGLSYYSDASLTARVPLHHHELLRARNALIGAGLIAFEPPLYQVLSLDDAPPTPAQRRTARSTAPQRGAATDRENEMIDYATFQRIQHLHRVEQLTAAQIALAMAMDARTVRRWLDEPQFRASCHPGARPSKLDPYKAYIRRLLEHHPYSAAQILNRLREAGYDGGVTIVKDYVQRVRPVRAPAFLTLHFAHGECAQV